MHNTIDTWRSQLARDGLRCLTVGVGRRIAADLALLRTNFVRVALVAAGMMAMLPLAEHSSNVAVLLSIWLAIWLAALVMIDLATLRLPDWLTWPLILLGIAATPYVSMASSYERVVAAIVGYATLVGVAFGYRALRKRDGLGRGDAKLFAVAGAWTGFAGLAPVLWIAATAAMVTVLLRWRRDSLTGNSRLAFGPYLALGIWIIWLFGPVQ